MYTPRQKVFWFAVTSRLTVISLQFVFNTLCPDHQADAFLAPRDPSEESSIFDDAVEALFGGLTRWDAQYFMHVAKYGYTYENCLAFFPLYPAVVRCVAEFLKFIFFMLNEHSLITISAVLVNFACFVKSSVILYDLSEKVFGQTSVAYKAAILYCINPASIFFTAGYSESMFAYLTFYSMLASSKNHRFAYLPIGLSALVRSNGLVNVGFPIFEWLVEYLVRSFTNILRHWNDNSPSNVLRTVALDLLRSSLGIFNTIFLSVIPYLFLQIYNYVLFCTEYSRAETLPSHVKAYAIDNDLTIVGNDSVEWCNATLPLAYATIQRKYWNVGFMNYYEFKQIPNFILAFPILWIMLECIYLYGTEQVEFFLFLTGKRQRVLPNRLPRAMCVYVLHGLFLTLFCVAFVHIQVSTRLLASASPLLYWYCAYEMSDQRDDNDKSSNDYEVAENQLSKWKVFFMTQKRYTTNDKCVLLYFCGYAALGCFMHSNFLPWT